MYKRENSKQQVATSSWRKLNRDRRTTKWLQSLHLDRGGERNLRSKNESFTLSMWLYFSNKAPRF